MSDDSDLNLSRSSGIHSGSYSDLADEADCDQCVAPPGEGASVEHYQKVDSVHHSMDILTYFVQYIKYLQLQHGKLEKCNEALNESNNVLNAQ
jgi:hypothetical protein